MESSIGDITPDFIVPHVDFSHLVKTHYETTIRDEGDDVTSVESQPAARQQTADFISFTETVDEVASADPSQPLSGVQSDFFSSHPHYSNIVKSGAKENGGDSAEEELNIVVDGDNPFINGVIIDEIDNSGLYYAYQEDIVTSNDEEQILTTIGPVERVDDEQDARCGGGDDAAAASNEPVCRVANFSLSPDHSYTSHTFLEEPSVVRNSALDFYEKFCGEAAITESSSSYEEEGVKGNNIEVSEIVYMKTENGVDNIQEITLLVKPESDSIDFQDSYKVIANGDSELAETPFRDLGATKIVAGGKSLVNLHVDFLSAKDGVKVVNCDRSSGGGGGGAGNASFSRDESSFDPDEDDFRPPYSYSQLIVQAIASTKEKQLTLNGIYSFITDNYKYYRETDEKGWKNSIRHNLSLNPHFYHVPRSPHPNELSRKGGYWRIDSIFENRLIREAFAKKKKGYENKKFLKYLGGCNKRKSVTKLPI